MFTPDESEIRDTAVCLILNIVEGVAECALDEAMCQDAPEGDEALIAEALFATVAAFLSQPGLRLEDITFERVKAGLGASIVCDLSPFKPEVYEASTLAGQISVGGITYRS
jgi:hypothetical protein